MTTHYVIHHKSDTVGVAVAEGIRAAQELTGWLMDGDETVIIAHGVFNRMFVAAACRLDPEAFLGFPAPQDAIIRISAGDYSLVETGYTD